MSANRAVVIDRWMNKDGKRTGRYGFGMRWRARFVDDQGGTLRDRINRGIVRFMLFTHHRLSI